MLYSRNLLKKILPHIEEVSDQEMINACGSIGTEIEKILHHPKLENLVIGKLIEFEKHNNANKLNVCQVKIDETDTTITIVCGANNLVVGKKVIVALPGCKLHDGRTIEKRDVRGVMSNGMLCGYDELTNITDFVGEYDEEGIILMDDGVVGNKDVANHLGLNDVIYEISIPFSNRNDLNGVLAFCQELAGFFHWNFEYPKLSKVQRKLFEEKIDITIDSDVCNSFTFTKVKNIPREQSPWSLKSLLINNGIRPINLLLDCLNYITLLTNVPSAAYDAAFIESITVECANEGEKIIAFNDKEYQLTKSDIVVKTNGNIICLGGIIGAKDFGVTENTKDVWIEFANFDFRKIRTTANRLSINTDASRRSSKEISIFSTLIATQLLHSTFDSNTLISNTITKGKKYKSKIIPVDFNSMRTMIGINLDKKKIIKNLSWFGFKRVPFLGFIPPSYRTEVKIGQDIIEEVVKSLGVNELPEMPIDTSVKNVVDTIDDHYFNFHIKNILTNNYFNEVKSLNTSSVKDLFTYNEFNYKKATKITSTHIESRQYLRVSLLGSLLKIYEKNTAYKTQLQPIFEMQKIYADDNETINVTGITEQVVQLDKINKSSLAYNVVGLKGVVNEIARFFNVNFKYRNFQNSNIFYDNECVEVLENDKTIGFIGCIKINKLPYAINTKKIYCFSLNLNNLINNYKLKDFKIKHVSNNMPIYKDISFFVENKETNLKEVINKISLKKFVDSCEFVDKFITDGKTSYTIKIKFNNENAKISTDEIDEYLQKIIDILIEGNDIVVRNKK